MVCIMAAAIAPSLVACSNGCDAEADALATHAEKILEKELAPATFLEFHEFCEYPGEAIFSLHVDTEVSAREAWGIILNSQYGEDEVGHLAYRDGSNMVFEFEFTEEADGLFVSVYGTFVSPPGGTD
jgi:hypothetical protein